MMPEYRYHFFIFILPGFIQTKVIRSVFILIPDQNKKRKVNKKKGYLSQTANLC